MNVLLIEPDKMLCDVYSEALRGAGYSVLKARGAQQAVVLADATKPDVVVLELQLPGHGGVEFLYEFRSYPEWQSAPIILQTFVAAQELIFRSDLGVVEYLYKPATSLNQLVRAVNEASSPVPI